MRVNRFFLKLKLFYRNLRLRNLPVAVKLFICFGFFFIFMILLSVINFTYYKKDKENAALETIIQYNNQAVTKIDDYFTDLNNITKYPHFRVFKDEDYIKTLDSFNDTGYKSMDFINSSAQMFDEIKNYKKYIQSVFIFNLRGESEYRVYGGSSIYRDYIPLEEKWFDQSIKNFGKPVIVNTFLLPHVADMHDRPKYVFSMARAIVKLPPSKVVGIIMINTDVKFFDEICEKMIISPGQRIVIIDDAGNTVYDTVHSNITQKLEDTILQSLVASESGSSNTRIGEEDSLISFTTSETTGWKIINIIPVNELNKGINKMAQTTAIITLVILLASFVLVILISRQIVKPMRKLMHLMKFVEKGNFDVKIKLESRDEIGILARAFNTMSNRVNRLIKEVYIDKLKQKDLELQMLQSQINPHFLYNSLDAINMMAEINNDSETSNMAMTLGKILRYGISRNKAVVTVREEIDNLQDYIKLQEVRFSDIYTMSLDIDKEIYDYTMIKLILQPLVENAINHGLYSTTQGGRVEIRGFKEDNSTIFEVTDNGKGMDEVQVRKLNDYINDLNNFFISIGLKNVNKRIQLHYGPEYGITITSAPGRGTCARVRIPCCTAT